ncbi:MAG TPA: ABC transporter substrate-binding protein [Trueperaceae bacterium]|nr:ABC transporter substrate-binding protein [Trueperaceae bacterium]
MKRLWLAIVVAVGAFLGGAAFAQGVTVHISCGAVGNELTLCKNEAQAWADKTGNQVVVVSTPNSSTDRLALYQQQLGAQSDSIDVYQIDVVWPGILGSYFVDLSQYFSQNDLSPYIAALVNNDQYEGKQVAVPWFNDAGLLYYRTDLLQKYGFDGPPTTWTELTQMAQKIQGGERAAGNSKFWGYVWQGNAYEGLTCDALEWVYSYGGGTIVDSKGDITINNDKAAAAINMAAGWVGTISPPGVTSYTEEESRGVWQAGNAAFMRNWPYAYNLGNSADSPIKGNFDVAALPKANTSDGQNAATLGGWQLAVSRFSKHQAEAADLVKYLTSADVERERAIQGSFLPSRLPLYDDPQIEQQNPFIHKLKPVFANAVARPATATKQKYNQVSSAFWTAVHNVLSGQAQPSSALAGLDQQLQRIKGTGW